MMYETKMQALKMIGRTLRLAMSMKIDELLGIFHKVYEL